MAILEHAMKRETRSAESIRDEVHRLVHQVEEVRMDGDEIGIPLPQWHEHDATGSNWNMSVIRNPGAHLRTVLEIIESAKVCFNLPD